MNELNIKIKDIEEEIQSIEIRCDDLLSYPNNPKKNYDMVLEQLLRRQKFNEALTHLVDVREVIINNSK